MNKTDAVLSKGQKLYEDNAFILLWTKFFGLSLLALTSYYVYVKQKKTLIKLGGQEKTYLMRVTYYLTHDHGVSPRSVIDDTSLFKDLSKAVADRGSASWKNFFSENSKDKAKFYSQQLIRKDKKPKN
ncbi:MAG: hypothetical protein ACXV7F_06045 [Methylomonas sp.]